MRKELEGKGECGIKVRKEGRKKVGREVVREEEGKERC